MSAAADPIEAVISRGSRGRMSIEVQGYPMGEQQDLASAVRVLCEYAIHQQRTLVVTYNSGAGKQHMTIDPNGLVRQTAAPAPSFSAPLTPPKSVTDVLRPGESNNDTLRSEEWVNRHILDPGQAAPPPAAPRKRRIFGRR